MGCASDLSETPVRLVAPVAAGPSLDVDVFEPLVFLLPAARLFVCILLSVDLGATAGASIAAPVKASRRSLAAAALGA